MGDLNIQLRLNGVVVDDTTLPVRSAVVLGDFPGASVLFPGASVRVRRVGKNLHALGRGLKEGESVTLRLPTISVELRHTEPRRQRGAFAQAVIDHRFLMAMVVVVLVGTWIDAVGAWLHRQPGAALTTTPLWRDAALEQRATLNVSDGRNGAMGPPPLDGPAHRPDKYATQFGYWRWLNDSVLVDQRLADADARLLADPEDAESRRVVAKAAYNSGHYDAAAWHYAQLIEADELDANAALRLAWALRRDGAHRAERDLYKKLLDREPDHVLALSGMVMSEIRLGRPGDAMRAFDALQTIAPDHPYTDLTASFVDAHLGNERQAVRSLARALEHRERLDREMQLELKRDIAIDPVFASLRGRADLRGALRRHLGAASPRATR
ncbi:MAG: hypothetical protein VX127_10860 [Myxococcota bacterium]|nr:hypothetical protein [Myxococcota bacterium]